MEQTVIRDKRGMTLIEIMIAMLLMTIVALALIQSSLLVINTNVKNELRDEAVSVAEQRINESRNMPFADLTSLPTPSTITLERNIRTMTNFPYTASLVTNPVNTNSTQVTVTVTWTYRGISYNHGVSTVVRNK